MKKRITNAILIAIGIFTFMIFDAKIIGYSRFPNIYQRNQLSWEEIYNRMDFYIVMAIIIGVVGSYFIAEYENSKKR